MNAQHNQMTMDEMDQVTGGGTTFIFRSGSCMLTLNVCITPSVTGSSPIPFPNTAASSNAKGNSGSKTKIEGTLGCGSGEGGIASSGGRSPDCMR